MRSFVVTGTGTDIGKTVFAAALARAQNQNGIRARYWKPVQAGLVPQTDSQVVARLCGVETLPEAYVLKMAASPHQAAAAEGVTIDTDALTPPDGPVVIEGAGGLMVPLTRTTLYIDVFARWGLPLILCARTSLGTINHTLLSVEAIRARNIPLLGVAFIGAENKESEGIIIEKSGVKRLGRLPHLDPLNRDTLAAAFSANFNIEDFA
jgi:dethiobiotin synthetase